MQTPRALALVPMDLSKPNLNAISPVCLFVNGLIFIFYAISVPAFMRGVHWLITLAAVLFILALPAIYHYLGRVHKGAAKGVTVLFGVGMILIIISDILFMSSAFRRLTHDLIYVFGNALFVICLFAIGVLAWKGGSPKWLSILSIVAGIFGILTYLPGAYLLLMPALLLVGVWSFAMGFALRGMKPMLDEHYSTSRRGRKTAITRLNTHKMATANRRPSRWASNNPAAEGSRK